MDFRYLFEDLAELDRSILRLAIRWIACSAGLVSLAELALLGYC